MMEPSIREPAVAGRFYPASRERMEAELSGFLAGTEQREPAIAVVAPHAGWMYSGAIAGAAYATVAVPPRVIVLCPNHTGRGVRRSLWSTGAWRIPGGDVPVDAELASSLRDAARLQEDELAHLSEHAIEVQLPFLRALQPKLSIVPVTLAGLSLDECRQIGEGLATAVRGAASDVLLVASTDMSHYISAADAERLDKLALERVQALDPEGLYDVVRKHEISMCGYIPTTVVLTAANALGAKRASLVRYGNSGETSGDFSHVVGYAGLVVR